MSSDALFAPFASRNLALPNRIVMAPMTRSHSPDGVPGPDVVAYYRRRAEEGVGLILTEGTGIAHPAALSDVKVPFFHGDTPLDGWAEVLNAVHGVGGRIMPQLWHVGLQRKPGTGPNPEIAPIGPSGLAKPGEQVTETDERGRDRAHRRRLRRKRPPTRSGWASTGSSCTVRTAI